MHESFLMIIKVKLTILTSIKFYDFVIKSFAVVI